MEKAINANVDRIKLRAKSLGMTMKYLSSVIGKYPNYLSCVRNGTDRICEHDLAVLADVLETTVEYLTGETDDPKMKEMDDEKRIDKLIGLAKKMTLHQVDDLIAAAEDILDEAIYGFDDSYNPLTPDKRELIAEIRKMPDNSVLQLRIFADYLRYLRSKGL